MKIDFGHYLNRIERLRQLRLILTQEDWRQLRNLFAAMLLVTILQVTGVASILPFMQLVSQPGIVERNEWLSWAYHFIGFDSERQMLFWSGVVLFVLFTASVLTTALIGWLIQRAIWATAHRLCLRQLRTYMQLPYEFFLTTSTSELLRRVVADVNRLLSDVLLAGIQLLAQSILALGLIGLMFLLHAGITLTAIIVFGGAYGLIQRLRHSYLMQLGQERIDADDERYNSFVDAVTGMKSIRVANANEFFVSRFDKASWKYSQLFPKFALLTNVPQHLMEILAFGGIILVVVAFVSSEQELGEFLPTLTLFALATYRLMPALHAIFNSAAQLSSALPVIEVIAKDLALDTAPRPAPHAQPVNSDKVRANTATFSKDTYPENLAFEKDIKLRKLGFHYTNATTPALKNIDIHITKNSRVAIVGATGSGKTTIVDLTVGLLLPTKGTLLIDDQAVTAHNVSAWRDRIAYVPQDVFLYDDTVANNIAFGNRNYDLQRVKQAAHIAQLDDFVSDELEQGYQTMVGEKGIRLSGGQRQRIGIARALYRRCEVILLDEATSALDNVTEANMMAALDRERPNITVITVAHRLSTIRHYDRVYFLSHGQIVDVGSYNELYARNPEFKHMIDVSNDQSLVPNTELSDESTIQSC
ncbi:MAG: ABC transporter ATP-binding protein [Motiliproteus sp.]